MNYYDWSLSKGLENAGVSVSWFTCDATSELSERNILVYKNFKNIYGSSPKALRIYRFISGLLASLYQARKQKVFAVHYHFFGIGLMEALMVSLAKLLRHKICITLHDIESFSYKGRPAYSAFCLKKISKIIVHNKFMHDELLRFASKLRIAIPDIHVVQHGNYLGSAISLCKTDAKVKLGLEPNQPVILFFGQIKAVKGLDILIKAFKDVINIIPNAKLVIAGKVWKDDFSKYENLIRDYGIIGNVYLNINYVPDAEAHTYYSAADVVVLPYRKIYQSGVLLMSMSYGAPPIASDLAPMAEIITDGQNGFTFKSESPDSLAETIVRSLSDPNALKYISANAKSFVAENFDWNVIGEKTRKVYQEMT
ncbi:glycosyltransferase involved in cell wall biosynthesis [Litorivivens lipolytica]|uniref:Glycosyltransferase involved in cell wall biosynthesis n=1 Tax=Litorivivens lipolytica TaxID=1524264 RepID=A0A7W4W8H4_9GAMM|nr:glycosyltransferase family 4 protein [Litorivivens lipolytica]MBB3048809.1 glycosyltransferase involved in cell wall biosynthesis [Litorivivens lipolytica]